MPLQWNNTIGWVLVIATLGLISFWLPPEEKTLGANYLIFFFHFPSAVNCMNFFVFSGICAAIYLIKRRSSEASGWDHWSVSAVEVGMLACTITLVTGGIWARAAWGEWDTWITSDPRLMSVYIMWFTYAGYLALRATIDDPRKKELFCAVFAVLATLNVPIVFFAIRLFGKSHHPMKVDLAQGSMIATRWFGALAFLVLYIAFWRLRRRLHGQRHKLDSVEVRFGRAGI